MWYRAHGARYSVSWNTQRMQSVHSSWMDLEVAPDDTMTQWQEANDNNRMLFKVGDCKDSNIRVETGT